MHGGMQAGSGLELAPAEVEASYRADGSIVLRSPHALAAYPETLGERLRARGWRMTAQGCSAPNGTVMAMRLVIRLNWDRSTLSSRAWSYPDMGTSELKKM